MNLDELRRQWDAFGRIDPFWAILTDANRRGNRWDPAEFFATGRQEIAEAFARAARLGLPRRRGRGLDFGCGAGRLTQAMAAYLDEVVGIDVAPSMIELARRHNQVGQRCRYDVNDGPDLSRFADASFDVVYSSRVLQHIEPRYAQAYVRELARVLAAGGYLSFDVPSEQGLFNADGTASRRPASAYRAAVHVAGGSRRAPAGASIHVSVEATNMGTEEWRPGVCLNIGNHWIDADGSVRVRDDGRVPVPVPWRPGATVRVELPVTVPHEPGLYRLQCDVVEEGVSWFADLGSTAGEIDVIVGQAGRLPTPEPAARGQDPVMEMHALPRVQVERSLADAGVALLDVQPVHHCGPTWLAFRYDATR
jgi:SAM-dependent methyltransferase